MNNTEDKTIAIEILKQLGGHKFIVITGAKNFYSFNNGMGFQLPQNITKDRISHIKITLNCMDAYDIEFVNIRNTTIKKIDSIYGIYNDGLQDVISDRTGLALTL